MQDLVRRHLDKKMDLLRPFLPLERPSEGWLRALRTALGMTEKQLAQKLGITRQAIKKIEKSEEAYTISLKTLQKSADALNCKLFYILVPESSLEDRVETQINKKAKEIVENISHSMKLENQGTSQEEIQRHINNQVTEIKRRKNISFIWDENK